VGAGGQSGGIMGGWGVTAQLLLVVGGWDGVGVWGWGWGIGRDWEGSGVVKRVWPECRVVL